MGNFDGDSCVEKSQTAKPATTHHRLPSTVDNRSNQVHVVYGGSFLVMYYGLVQMLRLKYIGKTETCFETHKFLINTSITTFLVAGLSLPILSSYWLSSSARKPFSPALYRIIQIVFSVTVAVANLTLLLILFMD